MEKRILHSLWVRMQVGADIMETNMEFPQKLKMKLPYDPMIPPVGIYPKKPKTLI